MSWLRVDVYDASGNRRTEGPLTRVLSFRYGLRLDEVGDFELVVPAEEERSGIVQLGDELRFVRAGEGEVFRGLVDYAGEEVTQDGSTVLVITGASVARELVWANTLLGRQYEGEALQAAVEDLLSGSAWAAGELDAPTNTLTARFDGLSMWSALEKVAQSFGLHLREDPLTRQVDVGAFGQSSGLVLQNVPQADPALARNQRLLPISSLKVRSESRDVWNKVIPLGAGEGVNKLDLEYCERSVANGDPYDVLSATGPDGRPYYYLEDSDSVAAYGRRTKPVVVKEASPLANSLAGMRAAANALYDVAATWLRRHKDGLSSYEVTAQGLRHVSDGMPVIRVGQKLRLVYRGVVQELDGSRRAWRTVDADLWLMGFERSFDAAGLDTWTFTLNTVDRAQEDAALAVARSFEDFFALQVSLKPYSYREVHGPERESLDAGHGVQFRVDYDENVYLVHRVELVVRVEKVRSNVSTSASAGSSVPTTSAGGSAAVTSSAGGGTATSSGGGGSHHHGFDFLGNGSGGSSRRFNGSGPWYGSSIFAGDMYIPTQRADWIITSASDNHTHTVTLGNHQHAVVLSDHTHSVSVPAHNHSLVYGIYEGPAPTTPQITLHINGVDLTGALGGPWDDDFTLDVTQYVVDANGQPLRQSNVIDFGGGQLCDLVVYAKSFVSARSIVPL